MKWPGVGTVRACKSDQEVGEVTHSCLDFDFLSRMWRHFPLSHVRLSVFIDV